MITNSINIQSLVSQLQATARQAGGAPAASAAPQESFASALTSSIDRIDALKQTASAQGQAFEMGTPGVALNDVMVGMAKADVAMQMGIQVRNRVINAYKDIMNMQV